MDQQYVYTILYPYMLETPQADTWELTSVYMVLYLTLQLHSLTENTIYIE